MGTPYWILYSFLTVVPEGSRGVFACCHCIVVVTLMGPACKGIRDWFGLPLSGPGYPWPGFCAHR